MTECKVTEHRVERGNHTFTRVEFFVADDLCRRLKNEIRALTKDLDLAAICDDHKMVKLSPEDAALFMTTGTPPAGMGGIAEHFGQLYRIATPEDIDLRPETCEQVTQHVPVISNSVVELLKREIPDVVDGLSKHTDDPHTYVVITNAPTGFPFGQKDDSRFQKFFPNEVIKDRHPTAEVFQSALLRASGHTIDASLPGRAFAQVTPDLSKIDDDNNRVWEEESASQPFMTHIDGANYDEYSSLVCLAIGVDDKESNTIFVHTNAILDELEDLDSQSERLGNGMRRTEVLKLDIFDHGPGANSTCMNVIQAPVILEDIDGVLRPRANLTDGRVIVREDGLADLGLTREEGEGAVKAFAKACDNPLNQHAITLKTGQVIAFSGELPHARTAFSVDKKHPRFALRLRGTSKKHRMLIQERNRLNPDRPARYPGM